MIGLNVQLEMSPMNISRKMSFVKAGGIFFLFCILFEAKPLLAEEYPFPPHVQIHYQIEGEGSGSEELYIKENKIRSIISIKTPENNSAIAIDLLSIIKGTDIIVVDLNQKYATQIPNRFKKNFTQMSSEEKKVFKWEILSGLSPEIPSQSLEKETILDKECNVINIENKVLKMKVWQWKDLILKWEIQSPLKITKTAISLDETSPINDEIFEIPSEIKIEEKKNTKSS